MRTSTPATASSPPARPPATEPAGDAAKRLRWGAYWLLIALAGGTMLGRILAVDSVDKIAIEQYRLRQLPDELAQQQRTLTQQGLTGKDLETALNRAKSQLLARAELRRPFLSANDRSRWCTVRALVEPQMRVPGAPYAIDRVIQEPNWDTIDMVKHDGHLYSSKPPLMPTLMAAVYWPIYHLSGASLGTRPYEIGRAMLVLFNLLPLLACFVLLACLVERFGTTHWGRMFTMAAATFGTLLTTFAVAINNHLPAAACTAAAVYAAVGVVFDGQWRARHFVLAGLFGALAAASELPALALLAVLGAVLLWKDWRGTLVGFLPAAVLVAAAFFGTNWIAHRSLEPAYLHNSGNNNWYDFTYELHGRQVGSYWKNPAGIDRGEPSPKVYALNVFVGHHGIFSLTPVWLLSLAGMFLWMWPRGRDPRICCLSAAIFLISAACLTFYLLQPQLRRDYGGTSSGLRWAIWLAPLWLLTMLPALDALASRAWTRGLCLVLLALSALSASYPTWNPWTDPWLLVFWRYLGW